ncbi:hypothetical protein D1007_24960 [Hordeum vulgare]|nr:hypothetical protein D1007_24960 [Hordeum vulgare]
MEVAQREYNSGYGFTPGGDGPSGHGELRNRGHVVVDILGGKLPIYDTPAANMRAARWPMRRWPPWRARSMRDRRSMFRSSSLPPTSNKIHALHLDPRAFVLLSAFAFLCEAFVGITTSMALLRHFFSLELISEEQCSGYMSLSAADALALGALDAVFRPKAEGFRWQWVVVGTAEAGGLLQPP